MYLALSWAHRALYSAPSRVGIQLDSDRHQGSGSDPCIDCYQEQDVGCAFMFLKAGRPKTLSAIFPVGVSLALEEH